MLLFLNLALTCKSDFPGTQRLHSIASRKEGHPREGKAWYKRSCVQVCVTAVYLGGFSHCVKHWHFNECQFKAFLAECLGFTDMERWCKMHYYSQGWAPARRFNLQRRVPIRADCLSAAPIKGSVLASCADQGQIHTALKAAASHQWAGTAVQQTLQLCNSRASWFTAGTLYPFI